MSKIPIKHYTLYNKYKYASTSKDVRMYSTNITEYADYTN